MLKYISITMFSLVLSVNSAPADSKSDCRAGKFSACSDVDVDDNDAKELYSTGCSHGDGYSCARLGQFFEQHAQNAEAAAQYKKACDMKNSYGCEFAQDLKAQHKTEADKQRAKAGRLMTLAADSVGIVEVKSQSESQVELLLTFPIEMVKSWNKEFQLIAKTDNTKAKFPFHVVGPFELFDDKGPLGVVKVETMNVVDYCENDGGANYRAEAVAKISKSALARPLEMKTGAGKYAAFVHQQNSRELSPIDGAAKSKAMIGKDKAGHVVARVEVFHQEEDAPQLRTGKGVFELICSGP